MMDIPIGWNITGRGVQALQAGFDTQIKAAQAQFAKLFQDVIKLVQENWKKDFRGPDGNPIWK